MLNKKTLRDIDLEGKKVLVRVDFNVPMKDGKITDDTRITASLPTINYLLDKGAAVILASHLGRPKGEPNPEFSLKPVADYLEKILPGKVHFAEDCLGAIAKQASEALMPGEVLLLENTRFYAQEEKNDPQMGKELSELAEIFVDDAFGTAHRAHASNVGVAEYLPAVAGFLLEKEINYLDNAIAKPEKPFTAILGGAKVSGKIGVIDNLLNKTDHILIGGGMANTFFAAQGFSMGDSLVESEAIEVAERIITEGKGKLILPLDVVIADSFSDDAASKVQDIGNVPGGWRILDIGPRTLEAFGTVISGSKTIVWNGPMGVFEFPNFAKGTYQLAEMIAKSGAVSIVGGGDSAAAVTQAGLSEKITHISTGGGASLELLEGKSLPGLEALDDR
jgi:phosphoglycerate kinase